MITARSRRAAYSRTSGGGDRRIPVAVLAGFTVLLALVWGDPIASWWNFRIGPWIDSVEQWIILHRGDHWLFRWGFEPVSRWLHNLVHWNLNFLHFLTWPGVLVFVVVVAARVSGSAPR